MRPWRQRGGASVDISVDIKKGSMFSLTMLKDRESSLGRTSSCLNSATCTTRWGMPIKHFEAHKRANADRLGTWDPKQLEGWVDRPDRDLHCGAMQKDLDAQNGSGKTHIDRRHAPIRYQLGRTNLVCPSRCAGRRRVGRSADHHAVCRKTTATALSRMCGNIDQGLIDSLGQWYLDRRIQRSAGSKWSIDKMPQNFQYIGWAMILLPHARIVHCARDPMDTILSCYFQGFKSSLAWSNRLDWLGHYYRQYQRLMAHWEQVLPGSLLHTSIRNIGFPTRAHNPGTVESLFHSL